MKKNKILDKLKKIILIILCATTLFFSMPVKSEAGFVEELVNVILYIPDGIMTLLNKYVSGVDGTSQLDLNLYGVDSSTRGHIYNFDVTPYDIFTSGTYYKIKNIDGTDSSEIIKLPILDINFFKEDNTKQDVGNSAEILRPIISSVYKSLRNLVLVVMLVVLLYVGIRIIIASAVTEQVKYKQWIMDWVVGICLVVIMQYIMSFLMNVNEIIVNMLGDNKETSYYISLSELGSGEGYSDWSQVKENAQKSTAKAYFYGEHLAIASDGETYNFSNNAKIDLKQTSSDTDRTDWGENGVVFINARIFKLDLTLWQDYQVKTAQTIEYMNNVVPFGSLDSGKWGIGGIIIANIGEAFKNDLKENVDLEEATAHADKAIYKCNIIEYIRTITSFGSEYVYEYKPSGSSSAIGGNSGYEGTTNEESSSEDDVNDDRNVNRNKPEYMGYAILYLLLVIETCMFLYTYIKRVFKLAFYTMIAPLIAFMYPIDKLGDGKAQAFNTWFKEYLFNVLIQPLHLLLYTVFIYSAMALMYESVIYAIGAYAYMIAAEKFFKKIFGFDKAPSGGPSGLASPLAGAMAMDGLGRLTGKGPHAKGGKDGNGNKQNPSKVKLAKRKPTTRLTQTGGGNGSTAPSGSGGRNIPTVLSGFGGRNSSVAPNGSGSSFWNKVGGVANATGSELNSRLARRITGGKSGNLKDAFTGGKAGRFWGGFASSAGKFALKSAGTAGGALIGAGAGALAGMATSAFTGEDKFLDGVKVGSVGGAALGRGLASKASGWTGGFTDSIRGRYLSQEGNEDAAARYQMNQLQDQYPDFFEDMTSDQMKDFTEALSWIDGDIKDEKDLKQIKNMVNQGVSGEEIANLRELSNNFGELTNKSNLDSLAHYMGWHNVDLASATETEKSRAEELALAKAQEEKDEDVRKAEAELKDLESQKIWDMNALKLAIKRDKNTDKDTAEQEIKERENEWKNRIDKQQEKINAIKNKPAVASEKDKEQYLTKCIRDREIRKVFNYQQKKGLND